MIAWSPLDVIMKEVHGRGSNYANMELSVTNDEYTSTSNLYSRLSCWIEFDLHWYDLRVGGSKAGGTLPKSYWSALVPAVCRCAEIVREGTDHAGPGKSILVLWVDRKSV